MNSDSKKTLIFVISLVVMIGLLVVFLFFDEWFAGVFDVDDFAASRAREEMNTVKIGGVNYLRREDLKVYLVIGVDENQKNVSTGSYYNENQSDFLLVVAVDKNKHTCTFLHINRDTMMQIPKLDVRGKKYYAYDDGYEQIALAHTYGNGGKPSCENTVLAVSDLLYGLHIDRYIALQMKDVVTLNDYFGGVTVKIDEDLTMVDPDFRAGEEVLLRGEKALAFIRARMELPDGSNVHRMQNQRIYMQALLEKLSAESATYTEDYFTGAYRTVENSVLTNCTVDEITDLLDIFSDGTKYGEILTPAGTAVNGTEFVEFYVDEIELRKLAVELYYDKIPDKKK